MSFRLKILFIAVLAVYGVFSSPGKASANNLLLSGALLREPDAATDTVKIAFDLSWDNSWRNQTNHDAAWIFVKYSTDSGATWNHATLKSSGVNPSGYSAGSGTPLEFYVPSDKKGVFVRRPSNGSGPVSVTDMRLVWDYGADGLNDSDTVRVKIVGLEMVYVPSGNFYAGDGSGAAEAAYALHVADNTALQITSSPVANVRCDSNSIDDIDTSAITVDGDGGVTGNAAWPVGYNPFYVMKHEITEGEWTDFFNTLTAAQKINRDITNATGKNSDAAVSRNTVSWASGDAVSSRPDRACSFLSWMDGCAFADWAALRPVTETEYEKASRGTASPVLAAMAWGSATMTEADALSGSEDGTEFVSTTDANVSAGSTSLSGGDGGSGPLRAGIFATSDSSRARAGAGYFGVLDLSGNTAEACVSLGTSSGRGFSGTHGDGTLTVLAGYEGNATNADWPGIDGTTARGVTGAAGAGSRGGSWNSSSTALQTSDRATAGSSVSSRSAGSGFRGGRSAS